MDYYNFSHCTAHKWTSEIFLDFITSTFIWIRLRIIHCLRYCTISTPSFLFPTLLTLQSGLLFNIIRLWCVSNYHLASLK
jgi:hypothetical protein